MRVDPLQLLGEMRAQTLIEHAAALHPDAPYGPFEAFQPYAQEIARASEPYMELAGRLAR